MRKIFNAVQVSGRHAWRLWLITLSFSLIWQQVLVLQPVDAAIGLRSTSTTNNSGTSNTTSLAINKPSNVTAGDVMVALIAVDAQNQTSFTVPSGWNLILHGNNGTSLTINSYYKIATGSEAASYTWSWTGNTRAAGSITAYKGVDNSTPIDVTGTNDSGTGTTVTGNAVTTVTNNAWVVGAFAAENTNTITYTPPTGMNERVDVGSNHGTQNDISIELADVTQAVAGSSGNKSATTTGGGSDPWAAHLFALRPAGFPTLNQAAYRFSVNADNTTPAYITDNLTSSADTIRGTAIDTFNSVFYTVGDNASNWVIEKRRTIDGSLCTLSNCTTTFGTSGRVTEDVASSTTEIAYGVAVDPSNGYIYVVGMDNVTGGGQWRIEKRTTSDGTLVSSFGTSGVVQNNTSSSLDEALTVLLDSVNGYIYVGGYDGTGNNQWSLQKYRTDNGNICTAANCGTQFGTNGVYSYNPSSGDDRISALEIDPTKTYLYVSGYSIAANGRTQWTVQKMLSSNAALCTAANCGTQFGTSGTYNSDPTNKDDKILAMQVDSAGSAIYLGGFEQNGASQYQWRIEKITLDTGALISAFGGSGCATNVAGALCTGFSTGTDKIYDMTLDGAGGFIYVLGVMDEAGTNSQWRIQKRQRSDGSLVSAWATSGTSSVNPSSNNDTPARIVIDVERGLLWATGGDRTLGTTNMQWYFTQLQLDTGTTWLAAQDTAAGASTSITFRLRLLLRVNTQQMLAADQNFKLQYSSKSGTCDTAFVGESYQDVPTSGNNEILYHDNPSNADAATAVTVTGDPADGSNTNVPETIEEANNFSPATDIGPSQDGLWDFVLQDNSAFGAYCFRVVYSDGSLLNTYNIIPEITFCKDDPKTNNLLRHGAYFCEGIKKSFFWVQ